jgi:hypothetical protein
MKAIIIGSGVTGAAIGARSVAKMIIKDLRSLKVFHPDYWEL